MSPVQDNGRPVPPAGVETPPASSGALAPINRVARPNDDRSLILRGTTMCLSGGLIALVSPVLACLLLSLGMSLLGRDPYGLRGMASGFVASVFAAVGGAFLIGDMTAIVSALVAVAISCVASILAGKGKLDASRTILLSVIFGVCMVAADAILSRVQGTSVTAVLGTYYDTTVAPLMASADIETRMLLRQARELYVTYWPTMYFGSAIMMAVLARFGALRGSGTEGKASGLSSFVIPRWVIMAVAVLIVAEFAATKLIADLPEAVVVMGANIVSCARIVLAAQGLGVLYWFLERRGAGKATKVASTLLAALLEVSFVVMSVVGIVDSAFGFRRNQGESVEQGDETGSTE